MTILYTRLIELGLIIIIGGIVLLINKIKDEVKFKKSQKEWIKNSFEWKGSRYHKKYFRIENGNITHDL